MSAFEQTKRDDAWVLAMSRLEEGHSIDVGGLYGRQKLAAGEIARRPLAKFVELSRRRMGQSLEDLAKNANVDLAELLAVENGESVPHHPQTIQRLAAFLNVNPRLLLQLAGLLQPESPQFERAALHFTARTELVKPLDPQEEEALENFCEEAFAPVKIGETE